MKTGYKLIILLLFSLMSEYGTSQSFFKDGDRVCFVGNSITNNGRFHHYIALFHTTRFPDKHVDFFSCGVGGDVTQSVLNRMDDDILINNPTHAVIMLGMNDVNRSLYGPTITTNADTLRMQREAIELFKTNLEKIVDIFLDKGITVILQKPSIYDQTSTMPTPNALGSNDVLKIFADYMQTLADRHNLQVVDYWTILSRINADLQRKKPMNTIVGKDRIHPESAGHFVMAYEFLKTENAPQYVSKIIIGETENTSNSKSENCKVSSFSKRKDGITFSVKENSLPFPIDTLMYRGTLVVPFVKDLNVQLLQISDLPKGNYLLKIDNQQIAEFDEKQLDKGINLALFRNTPQNLQAAEVHNLYQETWIKDNALRALKFIEYNRYFKDCPDKNDLKVVEAYLDSVFSVRYTSPHYKRELKRYIVNKPQEMKLKEEVKSLINQAYVTARPIEHRFEILRKK